MNHFYLTLPSDSSSEFYPENTAASFKTKLSERIDLDGDYEFGLAQLIYSHSWFNFNNTDERYRVHFKRNADKVEEDDLALEGGDLDEVEGVEEKDGGVDYIFSSGQFSSEETLLNVINEKIGMQHLILFKWNPWLRKVRLFILRNEGELFMSPDFQSLFGFEISGPYRVGKYTALHTFDLYSSLRLLYVYSDMASYSLVGDTRVPLLRVCDSEGEYGQMVQKTFTHPHYIPLVRNNFDTIEININNELGKSVPFQFGKSVVTLHFRRKNKLMI